MNKARIAKLYLALIGVGLAGTSQPTKPFLGLRDTVLVASGMVAAILIFKRWQPNVEPVNTEYLPTQRELPTLECGIDGWAQVYTFEGLGLAKVNLEDCLRDLDQTTLQIPHKTSTCERADTAIDIISDQYKDTLQRYHRIVAYDKSRFKVGVIATYSSDTCAQLYHDSRPRTIFIPDPELRVTIPHQQTPSIPSSTTSISPAAPDAVRLTNNGDSGEN